MLGSLFEFIHAESDQNSKTSIKQVISIKSLSEEKYNRKQLLAYETQDKSMILGLIQYKQVRRQKMAQDLLKQAMQVKPEPIKIQKQHWIQLNPNKKSNSKLKHKHRLLRAVVKTKQIESQDHSKSLYEKSLSRVISAYKKIRTQPTDIFFTPKIVEESNISNSKLMSQIRQKLNPIAPSRLLSLQDSVRWAKKHGKDVKNIYSELGKSVQLIEHQRSNKSNYQLQKQQKIKQDEETRRNYRKKFLKQIEYRIARHSSQYQQEHSKQY